jgi:hypothetical protein
MIEALPTRLLLCQHSRETSQRCLKRVPACHEEITGRDVTRAFPFSPSPHPPCIEKSDFAKNFSLIFLKITLLLFLGGVGTEK